MPKRQLRRVYDATTYTLYESVNAAAKALNIDANNIRKVLNGKRSSAGGHNFIDAKSLTKQTLRRKANKLNASLTQAQFVRQARQRGEDPEILLLRSELKSIVKDANKKLRALEKSRLTEFVSVANEVKNFSEVLGSVNRKIVNEMGESINIKLLNGSTKNIERFNKAELYSYVQSLKRKVNQKSFNVAYAREEAAGFGEFLTMNLNTAKKYRKIIPYFYEALNVSGGHRLSTNEIIDKTIDMMEKGETPDYIISWLETEIAYQNIQDSVFEIFDLSRNKWEALNSVPELKDNIIKMLKIEQLHPESPTIKSNNDIIASMLENLPTYNYIGDTRLTNLKLKLDETIEGYEQIYGSDLTKELDNLTTYVDVLKFY